MSGSIRRTGRAALLVMALTASLSVAVPQAVAAARPAFEMPFPCGQQWNGATYAGHGGPGNHYPLDFNQGSGADDFGKPVVASFAGTARPRVESDGDHIMEVDHGGGWTTEYRHLNAFAVSGGSVSRGTVIGYVGKRGTTSPHLHYEQQYNNVAQHIYLHGSAVTYSFTYNGPLYTSYNCGTRNLAAESTNGDRYDDLLAVDSDQVMWRYLGGSSGTFGGATRVGSGWVSNYNRIGLGDSNGDGYADIFATATDGELHYWHNQANGSFSAGTSVGVGWNSIEWLSIGDVDGDNKADILARDGGNMYWYRGLGRGSFAARTLVGSGWSGYPRHAVGDADGDGDGDIWATDSSGGLWFWEGTGRGTFASRIDVGGGWGAFRQWAVLDVNGDSKADIVAIRSSDNTLWRWTGRGDGRFASGVQIGHGWQGFRMASY